MGPLSKIWLLEAKYLKAFDDQSVKKIGRHLHVDFFKDKLKEVRLENQIISIPIKETLRKIPPPFLSRDPSLELGVGECGQ